MAVIKREDGPMDYAKIKVREGEWARSEFPHPLVTLDFDGDGHLLAVSAPARAVEEFDGPEVSDPDAS
jgi:hypothetical protein